MFQYSDLSDLILKPNPDYKLRSESTQLDPISPCNPDAPCSIMGQMLFMYVTEVSIKTFCFEKTAKIQIENSSELSLMLRVTKDFVFKFCI